MSMKKLASAFIVFVLAVVLAASANALPVVEEIKINGDTYVHGGNLVVTRGETLNIRVKLFANASDEDNVEVAAELLGYEYSDREPVYDRVPLFDMVQGDIVFKNMKIVLPTKMEKDEYQLRVRVGTRTGPSEEYLFNLTLRGERRQLAITDVTFNPADTVLSGRSFFAKVRVENIGQLDQRDIKVTVSMPGAGVSATAYIDELRADRAVSSDDFFLRVPNCLPSGTYDVIAEVAYDAGYKTDTFRSTINVALDEELCAALVDEAPKVSLVVSAPESLVAGEKTIVPVVLTNSGKTSRTVLLDVKGTSDWATVSVSPSSVLVVPAGGTLTAYATFSVRDDAQPGERVASVVLSDTQGNVLGQAALPVEVQEKTPTVSTADRLRRWLEVSLLVLLILLIVLGIIVAVARMRGNKEEGEGTQAYY